jgi:hypothetical protein
MIGQALQVLKNLKAVPLLAKTLEGESWEKIT